MVSLIPGKVKRVWDKWNLRGTVLFSLFLQVVLIFSATSRKRTGKRISVALIWSAYLLADWVAAFAVGLISSGQGDECEKSRVNDELAAFWAPFLLLHLGGPDTITAFSLEDNELWIRHLFGLVIQLVAVVYVFTESLPNQFLIPTVLLLIAGSMKYGERTRALYLACLGNFKASMLPKPDPGPNYAQLMEEYSSKDAAHVPVEIFIEKEPEKGSEEEDKLKIDTPALTDIEVVNHGYRYFKIFKGLIVDLMFSFHERNESRKFFLPLNYKDAFRVMEVELNLMYDVLYTKMVVVHRKIGYFCRLICSVLIVVSLGLFASIDKHQLPKIDIDVTYALLIGAVALDFVALYKLIFSDWTIVKVNNFRAKSTISAIRDKVSFGRWSKSVSQHSLIRYCLKERYEWVDKTTDFFGLKEFLDEMQYKKTEPIQDDLKKFIFSQLKEKALKAKDSKTAKEISSARGDWVLSQYPCHYTSIVSSVSEEVEYDESLLLWHIATELCYFKKSHHNDQNPSNDDQINIQNRSNDDDDEDEDDKKNREFCKLLSEYMLYLLVMRPTMMSAVAGIGQIRFQDTCAEAKKFFRRHRGESKLKPMDAIKDICQNLRLKPMNAIKDICEKLINQFKRGRSESDEKRRTDFCEKLLDVNTVVKPVEVKGDRSKSLLFDACMLAKDLKKMKSKKRWKIMSKVWVELLSYAASHCRANTHAQELSKGGELITFVWLLLAHFGLGEQFRIEAGHARAKLIVGK